MDVNRIKDIQEMIKNHQKTVQQSPQSKDVPVSAGKLSDDLSKVQTTDVIGKGGESDLLK